MTESAQEILAALLDDQAARDAVASELTATLFVEAGAGTGKTSALVGRIVQLVESGVPIRQIAAITFTEAAAAELKDRVRQQLDLRRASETAAPEVKARCTLALDDLDGAALQTLHAFAQRMLAAFPLEAGLPPRIEIADEIRSEIEFKEDWARLMDEMLSTEDRSLARAFSLGLEVKHLEAIARAFHNNLDRIELAEFHDSEPEGDSSRIPALLDEAFALLEPAARRGPTDLLVSFVQSLRTFRLALDQVRDEEEMLGLLANRISLAPKRGNSGNKAVWGPNREKEEMHELLGEAE
ncbi:MAG: UvrD-helicase domain-containing protein, partial [Tepidiformaceae bacterium]